VRDDGVSSKECDQAHEEEEKTTNVDDSTEGKD
jgi:hypothetical protein